jgi:aryl-alcohol dehydrogenase-like predicted oxidoreductase
MAERSVGQALVRLAERGFRREEVFLASKVGYIPVKTMQEDADQGVSGQDVIQALQQANKLTEADVVGRVHCLHPAFLADKLTRSPNNLKVDTLDLLYLHNAAESQLTVLGSSSFEKRLRSAFEFLEEARAEGKIRAYGLAT